MYRPPDNAPAHRLMVKTAHVLLGFVIVLIYARTVLGGFVHHDVASVRDNPAIHHLSNWPFYFKDPSTAGVSDAGDVVYRPLATAFFAVQHAAFTSEKPARYHMVSIVVFLLLVGAALSLTRAVLKDEAAALVAVALVAVHPLMGSPVSWISAQPSLLAALWVVLGLAAYELGGGVPPTTRPYWLAGALVLLGAAPFVHESGAIALALVWLGPAPSDASYRRTALAALSLSTLFYFGVRAYLFRAFPDSLSPEDFLRFAAARPARFAELVFAPHRWTFFPDPTPGFLAVAVGLAMFAAMPAIAWAARKSRPDIAFALAFLTLALSPIGSAWTRSVEPGGAEFVLPMVGLTLLLGVAARPLLVEHRVNVFGPALVGLGCACAFVTFTRAQTWSSPREFWETTADQSPESALPWMELAKIAEADGRINDAIEFYDLVADRDPGAWIALARAAVLAERQGRWVRAESLFRRWMLARPDDVEPIAGQIRVMIRDGRAREAVERVLAAKAEHPSWDFEAMTRKLLAAPIGDDLRRALGTPPYD